MTDPDSAVTPRTRLQRAAPVVLLAALSVVVLSPLLTADWYVSHEGPMPIERIIAMAWEMAHGDPYPRWLSAAYHGQGLPFFDFYSPLFYLLPSAMSAAGLPLLASVKVVLWALTWAGAVGMRLWLRRHAGEAGGLLAAILYLFVPYHFVDLYVRGALAEYTALSLAPFLFYGIDLALAPGGRVRGLLVPAAFTALLILAHNLSAMMFAGFAAAYLVARTLAERSPLPSLASAALGAALGVMLSAFYWLPALVELRYLGRFELVTSGRYEYARHFVRPQQWLARAWGFGGSQSGPDGMSFQLGIALLVFTVLAAASFVVRRRRGGSFALTALTLALAGLFMTTAAAAPIYAGVHPLRYVQFPWRFLGAATFFLTAFAAFAKLPWGEAGNRLLLGGATILCVVLSAPQRAVSAPLDMSAEFTIEKAVNARQLTALSAGEYFPRWVVGDAVVATSLTPYPDTLGARIDAVSPAGARLSFRAEVDGASARVVVPWFYFPGWAARVDGREVPVRPAENGFMALDLPRGAHAVALSFGTTAPRVVGWLITVIGALLTAASVRLRWRDSPATAALC